MPSPDGAVDETGSRTTIGSVQMRKYPRWAAVGCSAGLLAVGWSKTDTPVRSGDTTGEGVGGKWFVVGRDGVPIEKK